MTDDDLPPELVAKLWSTAIVESLIAGEPDVQAFARAVSSAAIAHFIARQKPEAWLFTVREIGKGRTAEFAALDYSPRIEFTARPTTASFDSPDEIEGKGVEEILKKVPLYRLDGGGDV